MNGVGRTYTVRRKDLLHPELSFKINGILFDVFKQLGGGHQEKYYQNAVRIGLEAQGISFQEQHYVPLVFNGETVGKFFLDFLIDQKIVLELKRGRYVPVHIIHQAQQYLSALNIRLALIACFSHDGVVIKRIINE